MIYLRGVCCGVSRWDGEKNEEMSFGMGVITKGGDCGVTEWVYSG